MFRKNKKVPALLRALQKHYGQANCELTHQNPLQLLVATILSAQCTDKRVNVVTPPLFKKFQTAKEFANVSQLELETHIRSTGFYRNKAKSIRGMAARLLLNHKGKVPQSMEALLKLPGVARKTANVVLGTAYGVAEGIVVDTHVIRLSRRLGLTSQKDPKKIERDLMKQIPKKNWIWISHALIHHGRQVCKAQNPDCLKCPIRRECSNPVN